METKKDGWEFTGVYFANCEIWKNGDERILYDPNKETWTNQYTIEKPKTKPYGKAKTSPKM